MFAQRTDWNLSPNPIARRLRRLRHAGQPILDLTESNPTRCGFLAPQDGIRHALSRVANDSYEPNAKGLLSARKAIAGYYAEHGVQVEESQLFLVHPGYFFDFPESAHLVLSLLPPPDIFKTSVNRLAARLAEPRNDVPQRT